MKRSIALVVALAACLIATVADAATLYITEYVSAPPTIVIYQAAKTPAVANQTVAIGGTSTQSSAFDASTGLIRVVSDTACHVKIGGTNPTATATTTYIPANVPEYFVVNPGDKIAVIN